MEVIYKPLAANSIDKLVDWIDAQNLEGSGIKWFEKLDKKIRTIAKSQAKLALCKHPSLARYKYSCFTFNDWVIAYRVTKTKFEVCRFILGSRLVY